MADPVGMIIEMTDDIGKQLTYAALEKLSLGASKPATDGRFKTSRGVNVQYVI